MIVSDVCPNFLFVKGLIFFEEKNEFGMSGFLNVSFFDTVSM